MKTDRWQKLPSVTRHNKFFYRRCEQVGTVTVLQSFLNGLWYAQVMAGNAGKFMEMNLATSGMFKTAKQAMAHCDKAVFQS